MKLQREGYWAENDMDRLQEDIWQGPPELVEKLMFRVAGNIQMVFSCLEKWNTDLISKGQTLGTVRISKGIFQRDSLSPLLFVLTLIPILLALP